MDQKTLSVIIVSYRNIAVLRDCLDSIQIHNDIGDALEVIVSDNSPTEELYHIVQTEYPWVSCVKNENIGFGAGNNRGYEISSGKYLLFLNPDTLLVEPVFGFVVEKFETDPTLGICGVQLMWGDGKPQNSFDMMGFCRARSVLSLLYLERCYKKGRFIDGKMFIGGPAMFVRRTSFEQAGRFDENIFMYNEEEDLLRRIKLYADAKAAKFFPDKHIVHLEGQTYEKTPAAKEQVYRSNIKSLVYCSQKYGLDPIVNLRIKRRHALMRAILFFCTFRKKQGSSLMLSARLCKAEIKKLKAAKKSAAK